MPLSALRQRAAPWRKWRVEGGWRLFGIWVAGVVIALATVWGWTHSTLWQLPVVVAAMYVRLHLDWTNLAAFRRLVRVRDWMFVPLALALYFSMRVLADRAGYETGDRLLFLFLSVIAAIAVAMVFGRRARSTTVEGLDLGGMTANTVRRLVEERLVGVMEPRYIAEFWDWELFADQTPRNMLDAGRFRQLWLVTDAIAAGEERDMTSIENIRD